MFTFPYNFSEKILILKIDFTKRKTFPEIRTKLHLYFQIHKPPKFVSAIFNPEQFKCRGKFSFEALKESQKKSQWNPSKFATFFHSSFVQHYFFPSFIREKVKLHKKKNEKNTHRFYV